MSRRVSVSKRRNVLSRGASSATLSSSIVRPELEATTKEHQARMLLGVFFVATMPLICHHISAASGPNLTFESWEGFPAGLDTCEFGVASFQRTSVVRGIRANASYGSRTYWPDKQRITSSASILSRSNRSSFVSFSTAATISLPSFSPSRSVASQVAIGRKRSRHDYRHSLAPIARCSNQTGVEWTLLSLSAVKWRHAKTPHRQPSQQQMTSDPAPQSGRGIYNMVPKPYAASPYDPAAVGGGSFGYNQSLHDNNW